MAIHVPFCHLGDGHHFTGFPPAYLFLPPELVGEPKLLAADDDPPPTCLRGALAATAVTTTVFQLQAHTTQAGFFYRSYSTGHKHRSLCY